MIDKKYIYLSVIFLFLIIIKFTNPPIVQKISFINYDFYQKVFNRGKVEKVKTKKDNKYFLINRFIENNPKISSLKKDETIEVVIPKNKADKSLMTETLAKVYLEQKKFSKAIKAYEILSLKYPEKSGFFADQIKGIKKLTKQ